MFSLPLWLLFLATTVTGSSHHSLTCSIGEPAFDVDCGAFHGSNHECRNNCKVKCSDGTGQMVLKISWLTNLQDQIRIFKMVSLVAICSLDTYFWYSYLLGVYMRGRVEIFESELFRRHCRQSNWQGPGGILGLFWWSSTLKLIMMIRWWWPWWELISFSNIVILKMTFQVFVNCDGLKKGSKLINRWGSVETFLLL